MAEKESSLATQRAREMEKEGEASSMSGKEDRASKRPVDLTRQESH